MVLFVPCCGVSFSTVSDSDFPAKTQFNNKIVVRGESYYMGSS